MASLLWIFFIQHRSYSDVSTAIKNKKKHCLQMQLGIKMDEFDVLICQGRFSNADIDEETKCPKFLPCHKTFTHLLIQEIHQRLIHAGVAHTLSQIRQEFWIPQGRVEVRYLISKCIMCKRHNGPSFSTTFNTPLAEGESVTIDSFSICRLGLLASTKSKGRKNCGENVGVFIYMFGH